MTETEAPGGSFLVQQCNGLPRRCSVTANMSSLLLLTSTARHRVGSWGHFCFLFICCLSSTDEAFPLNFMQMIRNFICLNWKKKMNGKKLQVFKKLGLKWWVKFIRLMVLEWNLSSLLQRFFVFYLSPWTKNLLLVFDVYRTHRLGTVKLKQCYSCFSVFNNSL